MSKLVTFLCGVALLVIFYGLALLSRLIGGDPFDSKTLILFGNLVAAGLIGMLGFGAIKKDL